MELFDCIGLHARISPAQCRANRTRPVSSSLGNLPTRPPACRTCVQWQEVDPPQDATDPAEYVLAQTLAFLWGDIEDGRLGVKYVLSAYNQRADEELRKRRSVQMVYWLQMLGFTILDQERFRGVSGLRCLLMDAAVEAFVKEKGLQNSLNSPVAEKPEAPCATCRYFRPLPTYFGGIKGVRLCWAERQAWDFACYEGIGEISKIR